MSMTSADYFSSDADTWGGPMNGVDLEAQAGISAGNSSLSSRISVDLWTLIIIVGALALLWLMGGVIFRRVNIF